MNELAQYLSKEGITQAEFARQIGESPQNVGRYVKGERIPDKEPMRKIYLATNGAVTANSFYELPSKIKPRAKPRRKP